ncbi:hypothetical protein R9X49_22385 [Pectobacterium carotovorum]|uniref:hypothetical protein n=1 Tax=Pectobacterium carotovorum TaxID=554 RepID=UPI0029D818A6|nr:hypothetical protein [Pectobacterium carotovorum]MDX6917849.1 hypothetical protein [Pectobacterium carotovorum]
MANVNIPAMQLAYASAALTDRRYSLPVAKEHSPAIPPEITRFVRYRVSIINTRCE